MSVCLSRHIGTRLQLLPCVRIHTSSGVRNGRVSGTRGSGLDIRAQRVVGTMLLDASLTVVGWDVVGTALTTTCVATSISPLRGPFDVGGAVAPDDVDLEVGRSTGLGSAVGASTSALGSGTRLATALRRALRMASYAGDESELSQINVSVSEKASHEDDEPGGRLWWRERRHDPPRRVDLGSLGSRRRSRQL